MNLLAFETESEPRFGAHAERAFVDLLDQARSNAPADQVKLLIARIMADTGSDAVRNAAAIALADLDAKEQTTVLVDVIRRPELANRAGTLLFALDELGASLPLDVLVGLIEHGSYEAKSEALIMMRNARLILPDDPEETARLSQRLSAVAASGGGDEAEFALLSLDYLAAVESTISSL